MHIVIYGIGAIGGFYAYHLAKYARENPGELKLSLVARGKTHEILKTEGLSIEIEQDGKTESHNIAVGVFDDISKVENPDYILLCTKSKDTISAAKDILSCPASPSVVSVQNGVDNEDKLASVLGEDKVIGALSYIGAENRGPGKYFQSGSYFLMLGELDKGSKRVTELYELLSKAGVKARISDDIRRDLWEKLIWNAAFNPISALYEKDLGSLVSDTENLSDIEAIFSEAKQVAKGLGIQIREDRVDELFKRSFEAGLAKFKTSMLQDHLKGKAIELDELMGILIEKAQELGIEVPRTKSIYNDLKAKLKASSGN